MTSTAIQKADDPNAWALMRDQATAALKSGFLPKAINTPEKAIAVALAGRELGLPTMQALRSINIIDGKPCLAADLMMALVYQRIPGALCRVASSTADECTVEAGRPGQTATLYTFTIRDAQNAGLTSKDNWRKYPRAMLRSRAVSEAVRATFPDALMGAYTPDELGAVTSEDDGTVIQMPAPVARPVAPSARALPDAPPSAPEPRHEAPRPRYDAPAPAGDDPVIGFGKDKGKAVSSLGAKKLEFYRGLFVDKLDKDPNSRFAGEWRSMLSAIQRRIDGDVTPAAPGPDPDTMGDAYEAESEVLHGQFDE